MANLALASSSSGAHLRPVGPMTLAERRALDDADRRVTRRLTVSELSCFNQIRLKYGPIVSLIDLSPGGAQIETTNHRLLPGLSLVIQIAGRGVALVLPSRVLRCQVAGIGRDMRYRGALVFKRPIELPALPSQSGHNPLDCDPLHEHARLSLALSRLSKPHHGDLVQLAAHTDVCAAALSAARAMIESPSGRRAGALFAREIGRLLRTVTRQVENGTAHAVLIADIVARLRRLGPARTIRLVDASQ